MSTSPKMMSPKVEIEITTRSVAAADVAAFGCWDAAGW